MLGNKEVVFPAQNSLVAYCQSTDLGGWVGGGMGAESVGGDHLSVSLWWRARLFYSTSPESRINSASLVGLVAADIPPVGGASEEPPPQPTHQLLL